METCSSAGRRRRAVSEHHVAAAHEGPGEAAARLRAEHRFAALQVPQCVEAAAVARVSSFGLDDVGPMAVELRMGVCCLAKGASPRRTLGYRVLFLLVDCISGAVVAALQRSVSGETSALRGSGSGSEGAAAGIRSAWSRASARTAGGSCARPRGRHACPKATAVVRSASARTRGRTAAHSRRARAARGSRGRGPAALADRAAPASTRPPTARVSLAARGTS
jgi:hypothetical protein